MCAVSPGGLGFFKNGVCGMSTRARTPAHTYPGDPVPEGDWYQGYGQLTPAGMREMYEVGAWLRRRYSGFLNTTYIADEVHARSTDKDRTLQSAETLFAAMFPPEGEQLWQPGLPWQPVPIHTNNVEPMLDANVPCAKFQKLFRDVLTSEYAFARKQSHEPLWSEVVRLSENDKTCSTPEDEIDDICMWNLSDNVHIAIENNKTVPSWVNASVVQLFDDIDVEHLQYVFHTKEMSKLRAGVWLYEVVRAATFQVEHESIGEGALPLSRKFYFFSTHDTLLTPVLDLLDVWAPPHMPGTAAFVVLELHQDPASEAWAIKALYNNGTGEGGTVDGAAEVLQLPFCDALGDTQSCPWAAFRTFVQTRLVPDFHAACDLPPAESSKISTGTVVGIVMGAFVVVIAVGIVALKMRRRGGALYHAI